MDESQTAASSFAQCAMQDSTLATHEDRQSIPQIESVAQTGGGRPSTDAVEFAIQLLREVRASGTQFAGQCGVAIEALSTLIPQGHRTALAPDDARRWAWEQLRLDVGTEGWTVADSINYYGFFAHGWRTRGQYEEQR